MTSPRLLLASILAYILYAPLCHAACVEVDSDTEAVAGKGFKMSCISCKMRGEVPATATVDWSFKGKEDNDFLPIFSYEDETSNIIDERFWDRLDWNGSKKTSDIQDGSLFIINVTFNDTGVYRCFFDRWLTFSSYEYHTNATKFITINVVAKARLDECPESYCRTPGVRVRPRAEKLKPCPPGELCCLSDNSCLGCSTTRGMASILSEVMMYVSIIGLQVWLVVEMVYCYRKISVAGEEALRESAAEYLAIASESKDNCAGVQVAE